MRSAEKSYRNRCVDLRGRGFEDIEDLSTASDRLIVLPDVRAREDVRVVIKGYHDRRDEGACFDLNEAKLMFWGSSDFVDLTDPDRDEINVQLECRPKCDCRVIATCGEDLTPGICGPHERASCYGLTCDTNEDCFDGQAPCDASICYPAAGQICGECTGAGDCESEQCVRHIHDDKPAIDESFCALRCPPADGSGWPCPARTGCKKLTAGAYELLP
jgi:hypothetical protein